MARDDGITIAYDGVISHDQMQTHIEHLFTVPEGTTVIEINFDHSPDRPAGAAFAHQVSLSLYDPFTGRGARHNNADQSITLTEMAASKGYLPGPLHPGTWTVSIDVHRIMEPGEVAYSLSIRTGNEVRPGAAAAFAPARCAPRGAGWYRGDLHGHTLHSDAEWDVPDFVDYARRSQLDFVTLTDHNTTSGVAECLSLAGDDLLVMSGTELTTFWGHCLAIGGQGWIDWRVRDDVPMKRIAEEAMNNGALFIIAHPAHVGHPHCTGCDWKYADMSPGVASLVEVWNADWAGPANNEAALALYYAWLDQGHRLVATAGSDIHMPFGPDQRAGYNVVWAKALCASEIMAAIRSGRLYLSSGPELRVTAADRGDATLMGQELPLNPINLSIEWKDCPPDATLHLVRRSYSDGRPRRSEIVGRGSLGKAATTFEPEMGFDWAAIEVRDASNGLHCLSNPVFFCLPGIGRVAV